jgi:hypothetical protein
MTAQPPNNLTFVHDYGPAPVWLAFGVFAVFALLARYVLLRLRDKRVIWVTESSTTRPR